MRQVRTLLIYCGFAGLIAVAASLELARVHPFGDAGLDAAKPAQALILNHSQVPSEVTAILAAKCADCHSNHVRVPLYGHFAPASWLMERDIVEARKAMNLSLWETYSPDQRQTLAAKIAQETRSFKMPPVQYRMIHWNARIVDADLKEIGQWTHNSQVFHAGKASTIEGDPARGKELFEKRCTGCHALTQNREGPQLQGVYGRTSGTAAGYVYSASLKKAQIIWDEESLGKWLTDPDEFIPGNGMDFLISEPRERQDLISFLRQSSGR